GLNAGTWFFRAGRPAPVLMRLPCGGGLTMGMFHSGEYEGVWSCFPGLKILYPVTPQETFEALVAGLIDRNPCLVLEHKMLYWGRAGSIAFDGRLEHLWQPRRHADGDELTVIAFGAMVAEAITAAEEAGRRADVWNPWVLKPTRLEPIRRSLARTGRLLVVQEASSGMGLGERLIGRICARWGALLKAPPRLVCAPDTPVPFAPELETAFRPARTDIADAIDQLCARKRR
ncbi:MAG: transketolase C-terminal domain-containing protein, partial [Pirellulales bacterium]